MRSSACIVEAVPGRSRRAAIVAPVALLFASQAACRAVHCSLWYLIRYHGAVDAAMTIRRARAEAGLSLRELARRAGTSHATLNAYEQGRIEPSVATWSRILRAAGLDPEVELARRVIADAPAREVEVLQALRLASVFPARHHPTLSFPRFGAR